jgi:hypothetical protein
MPTIFENARALRQFQTTSYGNHWIVAALARTYGGRKRYVEVVGLLRLTGSRSNFG